MVMRNEILEENARKEFDTFMKNEVYKKEEDNMSVKGGDGGKPLIRGGFKNMISRNTMLYGIGIPDREEEIPIGTAKILPKVDIDVPMPECKLPKKEEITIESVLRAKELLKKAFGLDDSLSKNCKARVGIRLYKRLKDYEHIPEEDRLDWCLEKVDELIDLILE